jgi:MoaA/NifB/PqqE/SkfB family radical SAM enzyme
MRRIGFELTDRCNLTCTHCLREINHDRSNIDARLVSRILSEGRMAGLEETVFTGGEPTLHPAFPDLVAHASGLGYKVRVVTNGQRPEPLWAAWRSMERRELFTVALSLEAADETAFNLVRGKNAYRRFMQTVAGLQARGIPTVFSFTVGPWNREQIRPVIALADALGIRAVSIALYQPTMRDERLIAEGHEQLARDVEAAAAGAPLRVVFSYEPYTTRATHLCATLGLEDLNINHRGELTFCCQLSSLYHSPNAAAVVVSEADRELPDLIEAQVSRVAAFLAHKVREWQDGIPRPSDRQPCFYCLRHFQQHTQEEFRHAA